MRTGWRNLELLRLSLVASVVVPLLLLGAIGWLTYRAAFAEVGAFIVESLAELSCASFRAASAQQALEEPMKDATRFDVVFSDAAMPGMDGIALAAEINRRNWRPPVVLTSEYSNVLAHSSPDGLEFLKKPYAIDDLEVVLRRAILKNARLSEFAAEVIEAIRNAIA